MQATTSTSLSRAVFVSLAYEPWRKTSWLLSANGAVLSSRTPLTVLYVSRDGSEAPWCDHVSSCASGTATNTSSEKRLQLVLIFAEGLPPSLIKLVEFVQIGLE